MYFYHAELIFNQLLVQQYVSCATQNLDFNSYWKITFLWLWFWNYEQCIVWEICGQRSNFESPTEGEYADVLIFGHSPKNAIGDFSKNKHGSSDGDVIRIKQSSNIASEMLDSKTCELVKK